MPVQALWFLISCAQDSKLLVLKDQRADTALQDTDETPPPPPVPSDEPDTGEEWTPPVHCVIIMPVDIWGRPLEVNWSFGEQEAWAPATPPWEGGMQVTLDENSLLFYATLDATDFNRLELGINYNGTDSSDAILLDELYAGRATTAFVEHEDCPTTVIFGGLGHQFFADSAGAPSQNQVEILYDGEDYWTAVAEDIEQAEERISWSTWWWESTFELVRSPDPTLDETDRYPNTIMGMFNAKTFVDKRLLLNRFWGESSDWLTLLYTDTALLDAAEMPADFFEIMLVGNGVDVPLTGELPDPDPNFSLTSRIQNQAPYAELDFVIRDDQTPQFIDVPVYAASWHQKSIVLDGQVAYVSGFNSKQTDWDGRNHLLYDPRRTEYDASEAERSEIIDLDAMAPLPPRSDYGVRIEGPLVYSIESHYAERWNQAIDEEVTFAEHASELDDLEANPEVEDGVMAQLNLTTPDGKASIFESHRNAIQQATDYIFIEDQYFRAPLLNDFIYDRMIDEPDLVLIVVTMAVDELDPGLKYTYLSHERFAADFPDRYLLLQLRNDALILRDNLIFDEVDYDNVPLYLHSKLRMIDDRYLSVGSCNMNNRGYKYEGEMNVSILDSDFVREVRAEIFEDMVGSDYVDYLSDDAQNNFEVIALASEDNAIVAEWWEDEGEELSLDDAQDTWIIYRPSGFVYPLDFSSDYLDIVGPDLF